MCDRAVTQNYLQGRLTMDISLFTIPSYDIFLLHPIALMIFAYPITRSIQYKSTAWLYICLYSLSFSIAFYSLITYFNVFGIQEIVSGNSKCYPDSNIRQYMHIYISLYLVIHMMKIGVHPITKYAELSKHAENDMEMWWGVNNIKNRTNAGDGSQIGNMFRQRSGDKSQAEIFLPFLVTCFSLAIYYPIYIYIKPCS